MSDVSRLPDDFEELLGRFADGVATDDEVARFEQLLRENATARACYLDYAELESRLIFKHVPPPELEGVEFPALAGLDEEWEADAASQIESGVSLSDSWHTTKNRILRYKRTLSVAAGVLALATILGVAHFTDVQLFVASGDNNPSADTPTAGVHVAKLTDWLDDQWFEGSRPSRSDPRLAVGRMLRLETGLAEITYNTGAVVILEGPAEYEVRAENGGRLEFGRLAARMSEEKGKGFTVDTPFARIADLGTEFGIEVKRNGTTDAYVYDGEVTLQVRTASDELKGKHVLSAGSGARIDKHLRLLERNSQLTLARRLDGGWDGDRTIQVAGYKYIGDHSDPRNALPATHPGYPDDDRKKLTDGVVGSVDYSDGGWVGWLDPQWQTADSGKPHPAIVFDLKKVIAVGGAQIAYLVNHPSGVYAPDRVVVSVSDDGEQFLQVSEHANFDDTWKVAERHQPGHSIKRAIEIDLGNRRARYIRLEFYNDEQWTFLSEVRFLAPWINTEEQSSP